MPRDVLHRIFPRFTRLTIDATTRTLVVEFDEVDQIVLGAVVTTTTPKVSDLTTRLTPAETAQVQALVQMVRAYIEPDYT